MTIAYHPDDLACLRRATGKAAEELIANKTLVNEYHRWLSRYHAASGTAGPLGPLAITILLSISKAYKAPSETIENADKPVDWSMVNVGAEIIVRIETVPPEDRRGVFLGLMSGGFMGVRLVGETTGRLVQPRLARLAPPEVPGVDTSEFTKTSDSVYGRNTLAAVKKIEREAAESRAAANAAKKAAVKAAAAEIKEAPATPATEIEAEAAAEERRQLAVGPIEPESDLPADDAVRESEWLWAEPNHKCIVEFEGNFPDAEYVRIGDKLDPNDLKLVLWVPELERSIQISEHKVQAKTPIVKNEVANAAADDL